jgi:acyl dehydratase
MATIFESPGDLLSRVGDELGVSDWLLVDQGRIDMFAEATGDHQWIHVDPVRAATGPFGGTIAHGYLTLALVNIFLPQIVDVRGISMGVNIGSNRLRFLAPVRAGSHLRGRGELVAAEAVGADAVQATIRVTVELQGSEKPACVVDTISRYYEGITARKG